jgi:hypothetical protein
MHPPLKVSMLPACVGYHRNCVDCVADGSAALTVCCRPAEVKFVAPGINTLQQVLEVHPDFDVEQDYYYNGFTVGVLHASKHVPRAHQHAAQE